jgi:hypothetical protein
LLVEPLRLFFPECLGNGGISGCFGIGFTETTSIGCNGIKSYQNYEQTEQRSHHGVVYLSLRDFVDEMPPALASRQKSP